MLTLSVWTSSQSSMESCLSSRSVESEAETFEMYQSRLKLHLCLMARLPTLVETEEVREAHA
jgi:hypothetical protein